MKSFNRILFVFVSLGLTLAMSAPVSAETSAEDHNHGHDEHAVSELSLNQGEKWPTDAPLRQGMNSINEAVKKAVPAFHHDELSKTDAQQLAHHINDQVKYMVANCKLEPQADATLHVLIGEMLTSADKLSKDPLSNEGMPGLVKALMQYPNYFQHKGWKSVIHE